MPSPTTPMSEILQMSDESESSESSTTTEGAVADGVDDDEEEEELVHTSGDKAKVAITSGPCYKRSL